MATVLVVDDSATVLQTAENFLEQGGHRVIACDHGAKALEIVGIESIDVIVTDIYMPEFDGLQLLRLLRSRHSRIPIIAMSGAGGRWNLLALSKALGACSALQKPFTDVQLLQAVDSAVARSG